MFIDFRKLDYDLQNNLEIIQLLKPWSALRKNKILHTNIIKIIKDVIKFVLLIKVEKIISLLRNIYIYIYVYM